MKQQHAPFTKRCVPFYLRKNACSSRWTRPSAGSKAGAAAQDTGLAVAGAEIVERDIEPARVRGAPRPRTGPSDAAHTQAGDPARARRCCAAARATGAPARTAPAPHPAPRSSDPSDGAAPCGDCTSAGLPCARSAPPCGTDIPPAADAHPRSRKATAAPRAHPPRQIRSRGAVALLPMDFGGGRSSTRCTGAGS